MAIERLDPRVLAIVLSRTDDRSSYAEIWRRVRPVLERRGLACPSYDTVRRLVREERARRALLPERGTIDLGSGARIDLVTGRITLS